MVAAVRAVRLPSVGTWPRPFWGHEEPEPKSAVRCRFGSNIVGTVMVDHSSGGGPVVAAIGRLRLVVATELLVAAAVSALALVALLAGGGGGRTRPPVPATAPPSAAALVGVAHVLTADWPRLLALENRWTDTCYQDRYAPCRAALHAEVGQLRRLAADISVQRVDGQLVAVNARFVAAVRATLAAKQAAYNDLVDHQIASFKTHNAAPAICIGPLNQLLTPLDATATSGAPPPVGPPFLSYPFSRC